MKPRFCLASALVIAIGPGIRSEDCNENGIDDLQEVMEGSSADCNGNGIPDGCDSRSKVELLEGPRWQLGLGSISDACLSYLQVGDLDGDGDPDFAVRRGGGFAVHLHAGEGRFRRIEVPSPYPSNDLDLADMDGDGDLDAVTPGDRVRIFTNDGSGRFEPGHATPTDGWTRLAAAVELNGDGRTDVAVVLWPDPYGRFGLLPLLQRAGGGFDAGSFHGSGETPLAIAAGDLDADGLGDVVLASQGSSSLWVFRNEGGAVFAVADVVTTRPAPLTADVIDMDEDGQLDIVVVQAGGYGEDGAISVLWNDGRGGFSDPISVIAGARTRNATLADLDRNGRLDIVAYDDLAGSVIFLANIGDRTFEPAVTLVLGEFVQSGICGLAAADFDLDGAEDVLLAGGEAALLLWNVTPSPREYDCDANGIPDACEGPIQDCDGDGIPDACDADSDRDGLPDPCEPPEFRRGDANADGKMDIADPLWILNLLFLEALDPSRLCLDAHDTNDDGAVEITDAVRLLDFLFLGSAAPPAPTGCGPDPEDGAHLGCARYPICL